MPDSTSKESNVTNLRTAGEAAPTSDATAPPPSQLDKAVAIFPQEEQEIARANLLGFQTYAQALKLLGFIDERGTASSTLLLMHNETRDKAIATSQKGK